MTDLNEQIVNPVGESFFFDPYIHAKNKLKTAAIKNPWSIYFSNLNLNAFIKSQTTTAPLLEISFRGLISLTSGYKDYEGELNDSNGEIPNALRFLIAKHHTPNGFKSYFNYKFYLEIKESADKFIQLINEYNHLKLYSEWIKDSIKAIEKHIEEKLISILASNEEVISISIEQTNKEYERDRFIEMARSKKLLNADYSEVQKQITNVSREIKDLSIAKEKIKRSIIDNSFVDENNAISSYKTLCTENIVKIENLANLIMKNEEELRHLLDEKIDKINFEIEAKLFYLRDKVRNIEDKNKIHIDDLRLIVKDIINDIGKIPVEELDLPVYGKVTYEDLKIGLNGRVNEIIKEYL
jgi:hypothetical protein